MFEQDAYPAISTQIKQGPVTLLYLFFYPAFSAFS